VDEGALCLSSSPPLPLSLQNKDTPLPYSVVKIHQDAEEFPGLYVVKIHFLPSFPTCKPVQHSICLRG
jgi:hypothetical protein